MNVSMKWMCRVDMEPVLRIENASFEFPWGEFDFTRELRQRNCIGMVAEHNGLVVGYMVYELHKTRLDLLNFAVDPKHRRKGVGRQMFEKLVSKLSAKKRVRISLGVRERNLDAQLFFKAMGMVAKTVLHGFYDDTDEACFMFHYSVAEPCACQAT